MHGLTVLRCIAGVSQREITEHFPGLEAQKRELLELLMEFFEQHIERHFPDPDYTFDVYVTAAGKVRCSSRLD